MNGRNLTDTAISPQRGGSDSTVTRTCQATGEALLAPARNHWSKVDRITGSTGKSIDGERVADGSAVASRSRFSTAAISQSFRGWASIKITRSSANRAYSMLVYL